MERCLLLFTIVVVVDCFICPDGVASTDCDNRCGIGDKVCYANNGIGRCCNSRFCKDTGLSSKWFPRNLGFVAYGQISRWTNTTIGSINVSCPIPLSALHDVNYAKYVPTDIDKLSPVEKYPFNRNGTQWKPDRLIKVEKCESNRECSYLTTPGETVGYCYNSRNPSIHGDNATAPFKFCYKLKELNDSSYFIDPDAVGLKFCDENLDCSNPDWRGLSYDTWYCHKTNLYRDRSTRYDRSGVCIRSRRCPDKSYPMRPENASNCDPTSSTSCIFKGPPSFPAMPWTIVPDAYKPSCINVAQNSPDNFICCQEKLKTCSIGKTVEPRDTCTKSTDCYNKTIDPSDINTYKRWCDPIDKVCCDPVNDTNLVYCPDGVTPLRFEKECNGYIQGNESTGSCTNNHLDKDITTAGVCKLGHCCPELVVVNNYGKHSFATNHPCIKGKVPDRYKYAYCDRKTDKVVVIGELNFQGEVWKRIPIECKSNENCLGDDVCVLEKDGVKHCYGVLPKPAQKSEWSSGAILVTFLIGCIFTVCFCGGLLICMWCLCVPVPDQRDIRRGFNPIDWILVFLNLRKRPNRRVENSDQNNKTKSKDHIATNKGSASKEGTQGSKEMPSKENVKRSKEGVSKETTKKSMEAPSKENTKKSTKALSKVKPIKSKETPSKENAKRSKEALSKEKQLKSKEVLSKEATKKSREIPSKENTKQSKEKLSKEGRR